MMNEASWDGQALLILQVPASWKRILSFSQRNQCMSRSRPFLLRTEIGKSFHGIMIILGDLFRHKSRMTSKMVRHFDQEELQTDAAVYWDWLKSVLVKGFRRNGAENFSYSEWIVHIQQERNKVRFRYCENFSERFGKCSSDATLDLMGHVLLSIVWKEFTYQKGCSYNMMSIMEHGLVAGEKQSRRKANSVVFTTKFMWTRWRGTNSRRYDSSRMFHYCSKWRHDQDVVYWVKWKEAQYLGLQCWQTKSHAIVVYQKVPSECIFKVIAKHNKKAIYERQRPHQPCP